MNTTAEYWNAELETRPWADVERWQAGQIAATLPALRQRSPTCRGCRSR
jgi:hypothetical protein